MSKTLSFVVGISTVMVSAATNMWNHDCFRLSLSLSLSPSPSLSLSCTPSPLPPFPCQEEFKETHRSYFEFSRRTGQLPLQKEVRALSWRFMHCLDAMQTQGDHSLVREESDSVICYLPLPLIPSPPLPSG